MDREKYFEEKLRDFFKFNIGYIIIAMISVIYIATAFIDIGRTGKTIAQIIADGAIVLVLGILINHLFDLQGMINGDRDERVQQTILCHAEIVDRISPYIDKLDAWCDERNVDNLRIQRSKILASNGMKYIDYFNEDGSAKEFTPDKEKLRDKFLCNNEKIRIKCFKRALRLSLTPISAGELTSDGGRHQDPFYLGRTKMQYEKSTSASDAIVKISTACLFGFYGVSLVANFSVARVIWTALQVSVFLITGIIKMYQAYMYVVDEYRGRIVKKIDFLQKFENNVTVVKGEK